MNKLVVFLVVLMLAICASASLVSGATDTKYYAQPTGAITVFSNLAPKAPIPYGLPASWNIPEDWDIQFSWVVRTGTPADRPIKLKVSNSLAGDVTVAESKGKCIEYRRRAGDFGLGGHWVLLEADWGGPAQRYGDAALYFVVGDTPTMTTMPTGNVSPGYAGDMSYQPGVTPAPSPASPAAAQPGLPQQTNQGQVVIRLWADSSFTRPATGSVLLSEGGKVGVRYDINGSLVVSATSGLITLRGFKLPNSRVGESGWRLKEGQHYQQMLLAGDQVVYDIYKGVK